MDLNALQHELETERLRLRLWEAADAPALYELARDPAVGPPCGWPPHTSVENSAQIIEDALSKPRQYAVLLAKTGELVGCMGLNPLLPQDSESWEHEAEIGCWFGSAYWGRGYAPEAASAAIAAAFEQPDLLGIWAGYFDGNERSHRMQLKLGFEFVRTVEDAWCEQLAESRTEHISYLSRERWESLRS